MNGGNKNVYILVSKAEKTGHFGDLGLDGRIILNCILKEYSLGVWIGFFWVRIDSSGGLL
jgi:hypothetical protein